MTGKPDLEDYKTVPERIAEFRAKHPEGRLRPVNPDRPYVIHEVSGHTFVVYAAAAYRTADDPMPGIGCAWEPFPGKTPYTRDSELMNAETSAWGRAIVAALQADTSKGIASREEVRNRAGDAPERKSRQVPDAQLDAEGRMTRTQAAEHDRLVKDTRPHERGRVQRGKVPPGDDPWAQDSPVDPERASALRAAAEDRPGSMMDGQHRAIELLLTNLRIDRSARDERRGLVMGLLRLEELESMTDLSAAQAATAIRLLQAELDAEKAEAR